MNIENFKHEIAKKSDRFDELINQDYDNIRMLINKRNSVEINTDEVRKFLSRIDNLEAQKDLLYSFYNDLVRL